MDYILFITPQGNRPGVFYCIKRRNDFTNCKIAIANLDFEMHTAYNTKYRG